MQTKYEYRSLKDMLTITTLATCEVEAEAQIHFIAKRSHGIAKPEKRFNRVTASLFD